MNALAGKVCVVGGGGNGLGEATARALANHGATVVINDLGTDVHGRGSDPAVAEDVAAAIRGDGGEAMAHPGDLRDFEYTSTLVEGTVSEYGRLDFVANFAGILRDGFATDLSAEDWQAVVETNLTGQFTLLQAACRHWRGTVDDAFDPPRSYLAVAGNAARGNVGQANYAAAKAGVLGMVRTVSSEMSGVGVRVNALVPNAYTRMTETVPEEHRPYTPEEMPPEKVAPLVAYLASDAAREVTGCTLSAGGDEVGVYSDPAPQRVGVHPGGWTLETLTEQFRDAVADGLDLSRTDSYL